MSLRVFDKTEILRILARKLTTVATMAVRDLLILSSSFDDDCLMLGLFIYFHCFTDASVDDDFIHGALCCWRLTGDFQPIQKNPETNKDEIVAYEKQNDDLKKRLAKNNETKMRAKVTAIEESKDLSSLSLNDLINNLKVHEMTMEKDSELVGGKREKIKSLALKDKRKSNDDENLMSGSEDKEYSTAKEQKCFRCGDPNHLIGECPKPPRNKDQRAFVGGSLSESDEENEENTNDEACLMAQPSNYSDDNLSLYDDTL
ncbi:zf-CCHC domain-containing protein [Tanacetum coccineum]